MVCVYSEGDCLTIGTHKRQELLTEDRVATESLLLALCRMEAFLLVLSQTL